MSREKISINGQLAKILAEEEKHVQEEAKDAFQAVAKETAKELRNTSPKKTGAYARSWGVVKRDGGFIVRNKEHPHLTHLLEYGHAKVNGGRVPGKAHIKPAGEKAVKALVARLRREL